MAISMATNTTTSCCRSPQPMATRCQDSRRPATSSLVTNRTTGRGLTTSSIVPTWSSRVPRPADWWPDPSAISPGRAQQQTTLESSKTMTSILSRVGPIGIHCRESLAAPWISKASPPAHPTRLNGTSPRPEVNWAAAPPPTAFISGMATEHTSMPMVSPCLTILTRLPTPA